MRRELAVIGVAVVLISGTFGVSAYTTGTLDRDANVDVVTDPNGLIGLEDGTSGDLVQINSSGQLKMDFGQYSKASGANVDAHFELGNPSDATNQSAFNITNNDNEVHDVTLNYTADTSDGDSDGNIQFEVYNSTGDLKNTATEESGSVTVSNVGAGETLYVVVIVDTQGLDDTANLSGTLEITAKN